MKDDPKLKTDSNVSSMRWAFVWATKVVLFLIGLAVIGSIIGSYINRPVDLLGITALLSPIVLFVFGGKVAQAKFESQETKETLSDK